MARRLRRALGTDAEGQIPDHLTWRGANDPRFWGGAVKPRGADRFAAHRRHRAARQAYLATLNVRPQGVNVFEFFQAHGLVFATDAGSPSASHLTY